MRLISRLRRPGAVLAALACLALAGCSGEPARHSRQYYEYFDTVSTVIGYGSEEEFQRACGLVEETLDAYHRLCHIYQSFHGINNLKTVNDRAGQGPTEVDGRLLDVLSYAQEMYQVTDGACNAAMGAVLSLWHDCREQALAGEEARLPDPDALLRAGEHCRMEDVILDAQASTVELIDPDMSLDLGAVAKGYAAERAAQALEEAGFTGYALSIGGNVRVVGTKPDGSPWVTGIQEPEPDADGAFRLRVGLTDASLVTSGSYERYFEVDGVRWHHIISPETLYPENDYLSVSVLTRDSGLADALSTALFNLSVEEGLSILEGLEGTEACWILADGALRFSPGFSQWVLEEDG